MCLWVVLCILFWLIVCDMVIGDILVRVVILLIVMLLVLWWIDFFGFFNLCFCFFL